jgi:hypothetical protein
MARWIIDWPVLKGCSEKAFKHEYCDAFKEICGLIERRSDQIEEQAHGNAEAKRTCLAHLQDCDYDPLARACVWSDAFRGWWRVVRAAHAEYKSTDEHTPPLGDPKVIVRFSVAVTCCVLLEDPGKHATEPLLDAVVDLVQTTVREAEPKMAQSPTGGGPLGAARAPAILVALVNGWQAKNRRLEAVGKEIASWKAEMMQEVLRDQIYQSVYHSIQAVYEILWQHFAPSYSNHVLADILCDRFLVTDLDIPCCTAIRNAEGKDLRGNARKCQDKCVKRHHLSTWDPREVSLWHYVERAVTGRFGIIRRSQLRKIQFGGLPTGMLFPELYNDPGCPLRYKLLAHYKCAGCGKVQWYDGTRCPNCHGKDLRIVAERRLIVDGPAFTDNQKLYWCCQRNDCGHHYPVVDCVHCTANPAQPGCDECPRCRTKHGVGKKKRPRHLFFYRSGPLLYDGDGPDQGGPSS